MSRKHRQSPKVLVCVKVPRKENQKNTEVGGEPQRAKRSAPPGRNWFYVSESTHV